MTPVQEPSRDYLLISPCRNEADYMRRTLDSVLGQSVPPARWVIVDDGSTDETPQILAEYAASHPCIQVVTKPDRGHRAVGPGVIEAFYYGLDQVRMEDYPYICKLDLDLDLPERYFETLMARMEENPRIGSCSGKPWFRSASGAWISEKCGDEMSVGMTKFYRRSCFEQIGGFVREVMWDAIDCHKARQMGWIVASWNDDALRFEHLRPMGSSQKSVFTGRRRHGFGQYYMGSDPFYFMATGLYRMAHPPYVLGGLATIQGYLGAWLRGADRHEDDELRRFIRDYQRRALRVGKSRAVAELEENAAGKWSAPQAS
ncbi:glycosyltransferase family A protein [Paracoccus sp. 1_MG-2023]|uniref:glycosyltransferase n=1 Tax=unclassified Paracoccus (in: a-proteobacteria) TaxID=2688777 RepID=UPI001C088C61|nr:MULTISPECIES: glycosyltransferase family A protein [unclassified Paracoccus (in: a-proteobacteria)]MBU2958936.1 glycosyltransferase [Paracoccus sp. C2R09]MDO6669974.1 glycosyltransferase family A protein [Paracoccus sp. 1_MG-2023]